MLSTFNPLDNVTPPIASCLGDLLTLFILALLGSLLVGTMDSPIPLVAVIMMTVAAAWFTQRVMQNQWVKKVAKGGWVPLVCHSIVSPWTRAEEVVAKIGAMLISSGTGMVLDRGVSKYRGFALLAISMTGKSTSLAPLSRLMRRSGLTGSIGAIHANRLSTTLHTNLHPPTSSSRTHLGLSALQRAATLFLIAFPCQGCFIAFVSWARWIDISLGWAGWLTFALTVCPIF